MKALWLIAVLLWSGVLHASLPNRVAVVVHATNPQAESLVRSAQARLEQILLDNGIEPVDREQSDKIKNVWQKLEDPGYFITAEDFVSNTSDTDVEGLALLYLSADVSNAFGGFFSASAQADVRFVDADANVDAKVSYPMGAPGRPPSDGITKRAALINAVQRAVDQAAEELQLVLMESASPRGVKINLIASDKTLDGDGPAAPALSEDQIAVAELFDERWRSEKVTCTALAPGGQLGVVGTQIFQIPRSGAFRYQGSRLHIVDLEQNREITVFDTQVAGPKPRAHSGSAAALDCRFVSGWRYLAASTGDLLSLWDTERGLQLAQIQLPFGAKTAQLVPVRNAEGDWLVVKTNKGNASYQVTVAQRRSR